MPDATQHDADTVYYVLFDGSKGHTWHQGHSVKAPHDFLLITKVRKEWEAWSLERTEDRSDDPVPHDVPAVEVADGDAGDI
jgi:hypothetical protein